METLVCVVRGVNLEPHGNYEVKRLGEGIMLMPTPTREPLTLRSPAQAQDPNCLIPWRNRGHDNEGEGLDKRTDIPFE